MPHAHVSWTRAVRSEAVQASRGRPRIHEAPSTRRGRETAMDPNSPRPSSRFSPTPPVHDRISHGRGQRCLRDRDGEPVQAERVHGPLPQQGVELQDRRPASGQPDAQHGRASVQRQEEPQLRKGDSQEELPRRPP